MKDYLGNRLPPKLLLRALIVPGGAFRQEWQFRDEGLKFRFFFILNACPGADEQLVVATASSQVESRVRARRDGSAVVVGPQDYESLSVRSVIDCGAAMLIAKGDLMASVQQHKVVVYPALSSSLLARLAARGESHSA